MKKYVILMLAMLAAVPAFSQKKTQEDKAKAHADSLTHTTTTPVADSTSMKKETAAKTSPVTSAKVDSIITVIDTASEHMDSLSKITYTLSAKVNAMNKELERYHGMYAAIKEKVLQCDFDPERMPQIL